VFYRWLTKKNDARQEWSGAGVVSSAVDGGIPDRESPVRDT